MQEHNDTLNECLICDGPAIESQQDQPFEYGCPPEDIRDCAVQDYLRSKYAAKESKAEEIRESNTSCE